MILKKKQLKITKLFKKNAIVKAPRDEDVDELQEEVRELEQKMREKQNELFQIQRNSYRKKLSPSKQKDNTFVRPQKIILTNSIDSLKKNLELVSILTSTEVQSYVAGEHCCVVFHMQHASEHAVSHGLRIEMDSGRNEVAASSLPLGFNLSAVMEGFDNVMKPECLGAIRKALVAYYDRLEQFNRLKNLLNIEAELFKTLDGSYVEISMYVQTEQNAEDEEDQDQFPVTLTLHYRVYDIRPKNFGLKELDLPEGADEVIKEQCAVFKKKPLHKAFTDAFLDGVGQYMMVQQIWGRVMSPVTPPFGPRLEQVGPRQEGRERARRRFRPNKQHQHNDDTFQPEDCSDQGEDDDDYMA